MEKQAALLKERVWRFTAAEVTPDAAYQLEMDLEEISREMNRILTEFAYNHVEGAGPDSLPKHIWFEGGFYRRLNRKTRNQHVSARSRCGGFPTVISTPATVASSRWKPNWGW